MSDSVSPSRSLPARPSLEQLKKQAKELRASGAQPTLAAAQLAVARGHGHASWPKLKLAVEQSTLIRLIEEGDAAGVRRLVAASPRLVTAPFTDGLTPLHYAAGEDRPEVVAALVEARAPLAAHFGRTGHSALSWAVTCESQQAARKLIELGVKPDLFCAAGLGLLEEVEGFWPGGRLRRRPSATGSTRYGEDGERLPVPPPAAADQVSDALYIACRSGRLEVARWLLDHGADPNWRGFAGATGLAWAEFSGNPELAALLRERGGSDELLEPGFRAAPRAFGLMVLAGWGFARRLAARLTADPAWVAVRGGRGTLLHAAVAGGQTATAKILLRFGADRAAVDDEGRRPVDLAEAKGYAELAALLKPSS
jgi:ankyrin repeat protein